MELLFPHILAAEPLITTPGLLCKALPAGLGAGVQVKGCIYDNTVPCLNPKTEPTDVLGMSAKEKIPRPFSTDLDATPGLMGEEFHWAAVTCLHGRWKQEIQLSLKNLLVQEEDLQCRRMTLHLFNWCIQSGLEISGVVTWCNHGCF